MRKALDAIYLASGWLAAGFIAAICTIVVVQVGLNLIDRISTIVTGTAIGLTIPSYADFTGFFLASASFLALAHTLRHGSHIRVTLLLTQLPRKIGRALEFWCIIVAAAISCYFTWYTGALVRDSFIFHDLSPGMVAVPLWIPQSGMLVGLAILSVALFDQLIGLIRGDQPDYLPRIESLRQKSEARKGTTSAENREDSSA